MLPQEIRVRHDQTIPVKEVPALDSLGQWDERTLEIRIRKEQPEPGKVLILMHELMHAIETNLVQQGVLGWVYNRFIRRIWGERLITLMSGMLFQVMGQSGMLAGVTPDEAFEFVEAEAERRK